MKQLLSLFLFLVPCLAWAQYPSNGNQKITLGEQTTADGLIFRGVAATDTVRKPSIDTMAYMVLDTTTNIVWHYKKATSNAWLRLNLLPSDTASMLTNYWRADRFSGTLPVANGGTNASTFTAGSVVFAGSGGTYTQDNTNFFWDNTNKRLGIGTNTITSSYKLFLKNGGLVLSDDNVNHGITGLAPTDAFFTALKGTTLYGGAFFRGLNDSTTFAALGFEGINYNGSTTIPSVNFRGAKKLSTSYAALSSSEMVMRFENLSNSLMVFLGNGNVGIGVDAPSEKLHVVGNARITAVGAGTFSNNLNITSDGTLTTATSDIKFKYNIRPLNYGLETLLQLKPVNFQWIEGQEEDLGFIAQDVAEIIPEAVNTNWNSDLLFRYESLIPILTKAIQEQQALIKALEQRIINLENK
jgi:hypothetical protein